MHTNPPVINEEDEETIYQIVSEYYGAMKVDHEVFAFTHAD